MLFGLWRTTDELQMFGVPRSPGWKRVRAEWLKRNPECAVCGTTSGLAVHHILPVHRFPALELDSANLLTMCADDHFWLGHFGAWVRWNSDVVRMAAEYRDGLRAAIERVK